jgi:hypothetical protein
MDFMRHVAILVETSRAYGRGLLRGIARYHREHAQWSTYFQPQGLGDPPPPWLASWRGDGTRAHRQSSFGPEGQIGAGIKVKDQGASRELRITDVAPARAGRR